MLIKVPNYDDAMRLIEHLKEFISTEGPAYALVSKPPAPSAPSPTPQEAPAYPYEISLGHKPDPFKLKAQGWQVLGPFWTDHRQKSKFLRLQPPHNGKGVKGTKYHRYQIGKDITLEQAGKLMADPQLRAAENDTQAHLYGKVMLRTPPYSDSMGNARPGPLQLAKEGWQVYAPKKMRSRGGGSWTGIRLQSPENHYHHYIYDVAKLPKPVYDRLLELAGVAIADAKVPARALVHTEEPKPVDRTLSMELEAIHPKASPAPEGDAVPRKAVICTSCTPPCQLGTVPVNRHEASLTRQIKAAHTAQTNHENYEVRPLSKENVSGPANSSASNAIEGGGGP